METVQEEERQGVKRTRRLRSYPPDTLEDSVEIAKAIYDKSGGQPIDRIMLAKAVGRTPASSAFRSLIASSAKYGLTVGNYNDPEIKLTPLGEAVGGAQSIEEQTNALRQAALKPEIFNNFYTKLDSKKFPETEYAENMLRRQLKIPPELSKECLTILKANGEYVGLITSVKGSLYITMRGVEAGIGTREQPEAEAEATEETGIPSLPIAEEVPQVERKIFIGHGKNTKPVQQLEKVLQQFKIPYVIAIEEPNQGRPISVKVAEVMHQCNAAILVFTCDEEFKDPEGTTIWRPSENVIYELGAASILYGERIVIFREEGIEFPANFRDLGYISFEKNRLDAKGTDLIKELIAFGVVKITV